MLLKYNIRTRSPALLSIPRTASECALAPELRERAQAARSGGGVRAVKLILCAAFFAAAAGAQTSVDWRIDTVVGSRDLRDNGPATEAWLRSPGGVALDGAGNLFIADTDNHRIRKVDSAGGISTVAGTGERGFGGDGGPAVNAQLSAPSGVALDGAGNLFIADTDNHRIRKVDATGTITTVAGSGLPAFGGDGRDGGPATAARLSAPSGVAVDGAGNLFIAESFYNRIRKVDSAGVITTVAGTGEFFGGFSGDGGPATAARLRSPGGVALDGAGNLFIADSGNNRIRKVDATGTITTIAGTGEYGFSGDGGPAIQAALNYPSGVALDGAGNVYIADTYNHRIRKVDSAGVITTVAGAGEFGFGGDGGPAIQAALNYPSDVVADGAGNLFIAATENHRIRKVDSAGVITTVAGAGSFGFGGDGGPATAAQLRSPGGVALDGAGNLFIADTDNHRIRKVDSAGTITTIAGTGERVVALILLDVGDGGPATAAPLSSPSGVAADGAGNLFIAATDNHRIRKVDSAGVISTVAGSSFGAFGGDGGPAVQAALFYPSGVAVDGAGNLFIADTDNHRIRKVDSAGVISTVAGVGSFGFSGDGGPAIQAALDDPSDVAVDGAGNVYIADTGNNRIRKVDSAGVISTVAGVGSFGFSGDGGPAIQAALDDPSGVAVDGAGNLFIADTDNHRIRKVDSAGVISTVAGSGSAAFGGFSGDGGTAVQAQLNGPRGVAVDGADNVYIADTNNHLVRKLTPVGSSTPPNPTGPSAMLPGKPLAPTFLAATPYSLTVEWTEPENTGPAITDYDVQYREVGSGSFTDAQHEGTALRATLTGLSPDTVYEVRVRARTATGTGEWSESGEGKTSPLPTGDQIYYFPHLAVGASWQTTITYINYSSQEVSCQTDFLSDQGGPLMVSFADRGTVVSRTDVLSPGGSVHQETNVELSAPLAPGWAWATCSGPVKASLLFRQHSSEGAPVAEGGVNATAVPATRFVTFAEQGEGQFGTGVAYANPSATAAFVTFTVRDTAGEVLASADRTLLPGGHDAHSMESLFGLTSFTGSIEVTSTEPIVSLSLNFEADPVFSSLPPGELDASAQGSTTYYFPHLAVGASWQTTITYINYSPEEVTCQTDFISDHGSPLMVSFAALGTVVSRTDVLPPGGSVHQETNVALNVSLAPGWARANCSGPVKASLLYRLHNSEGAPTAEAGVNATAVPATRFVTFAEQGEGQFGTGVAYANPSATAAHVTFTARDAAGQMLASVARTLLPGGHDAQIMAALFGLTSFTGSLEVTSTEPIVSLSLNFEADPVFSSLPPGEIPAVSDTPPPTPSLLRTTFGSGIWLVNEEIAPGRYFTNPASGCYWERLSDTGGSLSDILANEFISFDSGQEIVDIASSDYAFKPDSECGTWSQTLVSAPSSGIPPGRWLVGRQIPTGEYETNASRGCYWERLSGFSGRDIIANDFVGDAGRQIVRISSSDEGFYSDSDCGTWSRRTGSTLATPAAAGSRVSGGGRDFTSNRSRHHRPQSSDVPGEVRFALALSVRFDAPKLSVSLGSLSEAHGRISHTAQTLRVGFTGKDFNGLGKRRTRHDISSN